jgi:hypothetical protein
MFAKIINIFPPITTRTGIAQYCLALMFCANVVPLFRGQTWDDRFLVYEIAQPAQIAGLAFLALAAALKSDLRLSQNRAFMLITVPFSIYLFLNVAFSVAPDVSVQYAFLFFLTTTMLCTLRMEPDDWLKTFRLASLLLSIALIVFMAIKTRDDRYWGAIHPNIFGTWILATAILASSWDHWFRWFVVGLTVLAGVLVDSRFSVLAILLLSTSFMFMKSTTSFRKMLPTIVVIGVVVFAVWSLSSSFFIGSGERSLAEGGISGRDVLWEDALDRISHHVVFGAGFRTSTTIEVISETGVLGAHSGWISALDELGLIGFVGFLAMYFGRAFELFRALRNSRGSSERTFYATFLAGLVANVVPLTFQPNYINFGDPLGLFVMVVLFTSVRRTRKIANELPQTPRRASEGRARLFRLI